MIRRVKGNEVDWAVGRLAKQYTDKIPHLNYNASHYITQLSAFISSGLGVIFVVEEGGIVVGGIGGIKYPDILTGEMVAVELFWYTDEKHRKDGIRLLNEFENWAQLEDCKRVAMVYLPCSMPEKLEKFYTRRGYFLREMHFEKEIQPCQ